MRIGVCSWSLQPTGPDDLADKCSRLSTDLSQRWGVQLALDPLREGWGVEQTVGALRKAGVEILSGMMTMRGEDYSTLASIRETGGVRLDEHWLANLAAAGENSRVARELGITLVTFHAGFIPHDAADPLRGVLIDRLQQLAGCFAARGVRVALETGQETAGTLLSVLGQLDIGPADSRSHNESSDRRPADSRSHNESRDRRPADSRSHNRGGEHGRDGSLSNGIQIGVNFDPANMILYGMGDPVSALRWLAPRVAQIHIKDAIASSTAGEWGTEVPAGDGQVEWQSFFDVYRAAGLSCDVAIEREQGDDRIGDIRKARALLDSLLAQT